MNYTLKQFYEEAGLDPIPPWAGEIQVVLKNGEGVRCLPRWAQISGLSLAFEFDNMRSGLFDEMGTGKTAVMQAWFIWHAWAGSPGVAVMPPILVSQFVRSFLRTFPGITNYLHIEEYTGGTKKRDKIVDRWKNGRPPDIAVCTYDMFRLEWAVFGKMFDYRVLGLDEATVLRDPNSKTCIAIRRFMGPKVGDKAALVMNGTPANNDLTDLFGYIDFITPGAYVNRLHFDKRHVNYKSINVTFRSNKTGEIGTRKQSMIHSFKNTESLMKNLYKQARRVEKHEVMDLKDLDIIEREVELSDEHLKMYRQLVTEKLLMFDDGSMLDITASTSIRHTCMKAVAHAETLRLETPSRMYDMVDQIMAQLGMNVNKIALGCHYKSTVRYLAHRYAKYQPALVYGDFDGSKEKDRFISDPKCRVIIMNYQSGGAGIDGLQSVCHTAVSVEPTTVPGQLEQWMSRFHRSGQANIVTIYVLSVLGTIYTKLIRDRKKKHFSNESVVSKRGLEAELFGEDGDVDGLSEEEVDSLLKDW